MKPKGSKTMAELNEDFKILQREMARLDQRITDQAAEKRELVSRIRALEKLGRRIEILKDDFLRATSNLNELFRKYKVLVAEKRYSDQLNEWLRRDQLETPKDREW